METIHRDYADKGVNIYLIYKTLAHPEGGDKGYINPVTVDERLAHIKQAKRSLGTTIPWICDNMENELKHALGGANNSELVFDPAGKIVRMRDWSNPAQLRSDLEQLVGPISRPTRVSDLNLQTVRGRPAAARNIVAPLQVPSGMQPIKTEASKSVEPFYVKLRAEVERDVLQAGFGRLYLGFNLDPIYNVHWNHLAAPIEYEIKSGANVMVAQHSGQGPQVEAESDVDRREFLVDVAVRDVDEPDRIDGSLFCL